MTCRCVSEPMTDDRARASPWQLARAGTGFSTGKSPPLVRQGFCDLDQTLLRCVENAQQVEDEKDD
jgi:hypothetical protein